LTGLWSLVLARQQVRAASAVEWSGGQCVSVHHGRNNTTASLHVSFVASLLPFCALLCAALRYVSDCVSDPAMHPCIHALSLLAVVLF